MVASLSPNERAQAHAFSDHNSEPPSSAEPEAPVEEMPLKTDGV